MMLGNNTIVTVSFSKEVLTWDYRWCNKEDQKQCQNKQNGRINPKSLGEMFQSFQTFLFAKNRGKNVLKSACQIQTT